MLRHVRFSISTQLRRPAANIGKSAIKTSTPKRPEFTAAIETGESAYKSDAPADSHWLSV